MADNKFQTATGVAVFHDNGDGTVSPTVYQVNEGTVVLPATLIANKQTATTSATPLPTQTVTQGALLTALATNATSIFIGPAGVTTSTGYELTPGSSMSLAIANMNAIYIICASGSPVLSFVAS